ncbi:MAG: M16 family metallopeptidase [Sulfuriferula sp.]
MRRWLWVGLMCCALPAKAAVQEFELSNGLKVIVQEDHRSPVVVSQLWYRAGSLDEFNGTTGVAHMLEHMMFKGTKNVPDGQFSKLVAAAGGRENAFTNQDATVFFEQLQKDKLALAFKLEADRMQNLTLAPDDFKKENQVVMEERRMRTDDQPQALVYEKMMSVSFQDNPYRRPVIGWMNDLENMTVDDVRDWYHRWYLPNNATLVVAGDVNLGEVKDLAMRYFGGIPSRPLPVRKPQIEPPQVGIKRINVKAPAKLPYLLMAYHVPELRDAKDDWEPYALQVLAGVLDGNEGARLGKTLVRDQRIASQASASYDMIARGPGLFLLDGTPTQGKSLAELETALRTQIQSIVQNGVSEEEMKRVKAQVIAAHVYERDSIFYQAMLLGEYVNDGLPVSALNDEVAKIQAISAAQVQTVAGKYLVDDGLTVATLDPQPVTKELANPPITDMHNLK